MPTSSNTKTELLTPPQLARRLNICKAGVYRLIEKRQIPFHKVMGSIRFDESDVLAYLQQNRIEPIGKQYYGSKKN